MSQSLMDLMGEMEVIHREIETAHGALSPELVERLDRCGLALANKVDSMAEFLSMLEGRAAGLEDFARKVKDKAEANRGLKQRLLKYCDMALGDKPEIEGRLFTLKRVKNPPSLVVESEKELMRSVPSAVTITQITKIDKGVVKAAIKDGQEVKGAHIEQGTRVEIK